MDAKETKRNLKKAEQTKPGIAIDIADDEKVSGKRVEDATKCLNNNHAGDSDYQAEP